MTARIGIDFWLLVFAVVAALVLEQVAPRFVWLGPLLFGAVVLVFGRMPLFGVWAGSEVRGLPARVVGIALIAGAVAIALTRG